MRDLPEIIKTLQEITADLQVLANHLDVVPSKELSDIAKAVTEMEDEDIEVSTMVEPEQVVEPESDLEVPTMIESEQVVEPEPEQEVTQVEEQKKKTIDLESFIGKNITVIVASILIFVGLIAVASVVLPHLTEELKFALMLIVSTGFAVAGYNLTKKNASNFNVALLACGLGAIYITLFTGKIYFHFVGTVPLYMSLIVWILVMCHCSKFKSIIFGLIGQAGVLISLILGAYEVMNMGATYVLFLTIYTVVAEVIYSCFFKYKNYIINVAATFLCVVILMNPIYDALSEEINAVLVLSAILCLCLFIYALAQNIIAIKRDKISAEYYVITNFISAYAWAMQSFRLANLCNNSDIAMYLIAGYAFVIFAITEYIYYDSKREQIINALSIIASIFCIFAFATKNNHYISITIIALALIVYLCISKSTCTKDLMYIVFPLSQFANVLVMPTIWHRVVEEDLVELNGVNVFYNITNVLLSILIYWVLKHFKALEKTYEKVIAYVSLATGTIVHSVIWTEYLFSKTDLVIIGKAFVAMIVLIIAASMQRHFRFNREFMTSKSTFYTFAGINAFSMILGLTYIAYLGSNRYLNVAEGFGLRVVPFTVVLCLTTCLFLLNFSNILDKHNSTLSLYLGAK